MNWNKLDKNNVFRAVLTDLSKIFVCIPYKLLVAKRDAYDFNKDTVADYEPTYTYIQKTGSNVSK